MILRGLVALLIAVLAPVTAWAQGALLQGGPFTQGHPPMYSSPPGSTQATVQDSGPAGGGGVGLGLSELLQVNRFPGTGPSGAHNCFYDNPITLAYHYFCLDANANSGGLLTYGAGAGASQLPFNLNTGGPLNFNVGGALNFTVNGVVYPFPFTDTTSTHVPSQAALASYNIASTTMIRDGILVPGDSPSVSFTLTNGACSLFSGAGDVGSQVPFIGGGKCWIANLSGIKPTPMIWGCAGNGTTDDTVCVQNAIKAVAAAGMTLYFDAGHLYKITAPLSVTTPLDIEGPFRYGTWTTAPTGATNSCTWGLVTPNTGITMLSVSSITATIRGMCIDMVGGGYGISATSGTAIQLMPPSAITYQTGVHVEQNTIIGPYAGITTDGIYSPNCCGQGTSADGIVISHNTIVNPGAVAMRNGLNTSHQASPGITYLDNAVVCFGSASKANGIGLALYDGGVWYDGTQNGPEGCHIGILIAPGTVGGQSQIASFNGDGVFGDQSGFHDLMVQPTTGGEVFPLIIGGKGPWASATSNVNSILIDCATFQGFCFEFTITNGMFHGGNGQNQPIMDIEGGTNGPFDITIANNAFCLNAGTPGGGASALKLNAGSGATGRWIITGNRFGAGCGAGTTLPTGLGLIINPLSTSNGAVTIVGNDFSAITTTPISYTPNQGTDLVIIHDNGGIDSFSASVTGITTSTTTLALPVNFYNTIGLFGTSGAAPTITSLTHITAYPNREIKLVNGIAGGGTVTFSAGTGICNAATLSALGMLFGRWNASGLCYNLH